MRWPGCASVPRRDGARRRACVPASWFSQRRTGNMLQRSHGAMEPCRNEVTASKVELTAYSLSGILGLQQTDDRWHRTLPSRKPARPSSPPHCGRAPNAFAPWRGRSPTTLRLRHCASTPTSWTRRPRPWKPAHETARAWRQSVGGAGRMIRTLSPESVIARRAAPKQSPA